MFGAVQKCSDSRHAKIDQAFQKSHAISILPDNEAARRRRHRRIM